MRQITSEDKFSSQNSAGVMTSARTSRASRTSGSVIKGKSMSSSICRLPIWDQIRSYSRRTSSLVGCGDQSVPPRRRYSRHTSTRAIAPIQGRVKREAQRVRRQRHRVALFARRASIESRLSAATISAVSNSHSAMRYSIAKMSS